MSILVDLNIASNPKALVVSVFEKTCSDFLDIEYKNPSKYVEKLWGRYLRHRDELLKNDQQKRNVNGKIFEYILATLLVRERILPFYLNSKVAFVPNINFDIMLYDNAYGPICLSAKTSFRERYKQADLEAIALKYVYRRSLSYLITLTENDAEMVNKKKANGDIIGLDKAIYALSTDFNGLIYSLKEMNTTKAARIDIISSNHIVEQSLVDDLFDL